MFLKEHEAVASLGKHTIEHTGRQPFLARFTAKTIGNSKTVWTFVVTTVSAVSGYVAVADKFAKVGEQVSTVTAINPAESAADFFSSAASFVHPLIANMQTPKSRVNIYCMGMKV